MENYKKVLIVFGLLLLFALVSPVIIAWISVILSPIISTTGVIAIIFIATVMIAWFGKIGRKQMADREACSAARLARFGKT